MNVALNAGAVRRHALDIVGSIVESRRAPEASISFLEVFHGTKTMRAREGLAAHDRSFLGLRRGVVDPYTVAPV